MGGNVLAPAAAELDVERHGMGVRHVERDGGAQRHVVGGCRALRLAGRAGPRRRQGRRTRTTDSRHCSR